MFASFLLLITAFTFQTMNITKFVESHPIYDGRQVQVCVNKQCVVVDRSNPLETEVKGEIKILENDRATVTEVIRVILEYLSDFPGDIDLNYHEQTIGADGSEYSVDVGIYLDQEPPSSQSPDK